MSRRESNERQQEGAFSTGRIQGQGWLLMLAALSAAAAILAPSLPLAASGLGFLATGVAVWRLLECTTSTSAGVLSSNDLLGLGVGPAVLGTLSERCPPNAAGARHAPSSVSPELEPSAAPASSRRAGYQRVRKLGEGTMGTLWLAHHSQLGRSAVLKEIRGTVITPQDLRRFHREAQVLAQMRCIHTTQLYDFGVGPKGAPYYVMEYLDGQDLQTLVDRQGPMPYARAIHVLRQVCMSLDEAHRAGLVHRDIKPANIMLCRYGTEYDFVKLLDFGLVKRRTNKDVSSITGDPVVLGTPAYMAPESLLGSKFVDGRADLYALGATGFFLVTGHLLFEYDNPLRMANAHVQEPAPRASDWAEIPRELDDWISACLCKEPEGRPQTSGKALQYLEELAAMFPWSREDAESGWS